MPADRIGSAINARNRMRLPCVPLGDDEKLESYRRGRDDRRGGFRLHRLG